MEYIIIGIMSISIFTYIVYILINKMLVVHMHIKYLILCACCALLISLILPRIFVGFAGLTGTLGIVILFAIISSYCITYYYDDTMGKSAPANALVPNFVEDLEDLEDLEEKDQTEDIALIGPQSRPQMQLEEYLNNNKNIEQSPYIVTETTGVCILESSEVMLSDDLTKIIQKNSEESIIKDNKVIIDSVVKKYYYPIRYVEKNRNSIALKNKNIIKQNNLEISLENTVKIVTKAKDFKYSMNFKNKRNILNTPLVLETIHKHLATPIANEPSEPHFESDDLDSLMDFAFLQKEHRNFRQALIYFRQALKLYPNSEVGPFLVMEIGTILKNLGLYNEAIEVFIEGRLLPTVMNNSMLEQEFINNIAYLRIVKNILVKNSLEFMPLNDIPVNAIAEIDSDFCDWRNQS